MPKSDRNRPLHLLLTGATGFLGSHLLADFLRAGHRVTILRRPTSPITRIARFLPDIRDVPLTPDNLSLAFRERPVDAVVHAAGAFGRRGETAADLIQANLVFPLELLEAAIHYGVPRFLYADTVLPPGVSPYALSKHQMLEWGKKLSNRVGFVNLRLDQLYGPGDGEEKLVTWLLQQMEKGVSPIPMTPGAQERDFLFIEDGVAAFRTVLNKLPACNGFTTLDVGGGHPTSLRQFVTLLRQEFERQRNRAVSSQFDFGALAYRDGELMHPNLNLEPLRQLGWTARYDLPTGISLTVKSYLESSRPIVPHRMGSS